MKTNLEQYNYLKSHWEKEYNNSIKPGFLNKTEQDLINQVFNLPEKHLIAIQNLRDFVVLISRQDSTELHNPIAWDLMSAITHVLDQHLYQIK